MNTQKSKVIAEGMNDSAQAPKGKRIYYLCTNCNDLIPSQPKDNIGCRCGNVFIDIDYFRLVVREFAQFKAVERT